MDIANLVVNLQANIASYVSGFNKASSVTNAWAKQVRSDLGSIAGETKNIGSGFKEVSRIVQGIAVSRVIYDTINAVQECTKAVWDFSNQIEYADMVYTNLFGNAALADEFLNVLEDVAAVTPFQFTDLEKATKRLSAYGVEAKNIMYITQGIMAASTSQGNPAAIETISRALGQIYTKGTLKAEEARQLAEAGIPVYAILAEKIGLTQEQLGELGDQAIPASVAINALVDGMNEKFGGVLEQANMTTQGIISNIKDNATMLAAGVFEPWMANVKDMLAAVGDFFFELKKIYTLKGVGGILNNLFPPEVVKTIRLFLANIMLLGNSIKELLTPAAKVLQAALYGLVQAFNFLASYISAAIAILGRVVGYFNTSTNALQILSTAVMIGATAWVVWRTAVLAAGVVVSVVKVIMSLASAVKLLTVTLFSHPLLAMFTLLAVGAGALAFKYSKLGETIGKLVGQFQALAGVKANELFMKPQKDRAADISKFNEKLSGTADAMDGVAKSSKKAAKAAKEAEKGLLAFDEVFKLSESAKVDDEVTKLPEIDVGDLGDLGADLDAGQLDFTDFAKAFADKLHLALSDEIKKKFAQVGLGALLGAVIGGILGGPLGAALGAVAGGIAGYLWDAIADAIGLLGAERLTMPLGAALGAVIGGLIGGPAGALLGAAIGGLVGWLAGALYEGFVNGDWHVAAISTTLGGLIGAAIGGIVGGPAGALLGLSIGTAVGRIAGLLYEGFTTGDWKVSQLSTSIGGLIGTAIGAVVGQPMLGSAIGSVVGWLAGQLIENWDTIGPKLVEVKDSMINWAKDVGSNIASWVKDAGPAIADFCMDAAYNIGEFVGKGVGWFTKFVMDGSASIIEFFLHTLPQAIQNLPQVMEQIKTSWDNFWNVTLPTAMNNFGTWISTIASDAISWGENIVKGIIEGFWAGFDWLMEAVGQFCQGFIDGFKEVLGIHSPATTMLPIGENVILGVLSGMWEGMGQLLQGILAMGNQVITNVGNWFVGMGNSIGTFVSSTANQIGTWVTTQAGNFQKFASDSANKISSFASKGVEKISSFVTNTAQRISTWGSNMQSKFVTITSTLGNRIGQFVSDGVSKISNFANTTAGRISSWGSSMISTAGTAMSNFGSSISSGLSNALSSIGSFCSSALSQISSWASSFGSWISSTLSSAASAVGNFMSGIGSRVSGAVSRVTGGGTNVGHATGGIFNREHMANFAEGNKAEAIIPLENDTAMQPFVDAVANGITQSLAPILVNMGRSDSQQMQPLYVGTLIADNRGLKELERKMQVIRLQETDRRG